MYIWSSEMSSCWLVQGSSKVGQTCNEVEVKAETEGSRQTRACWECVSGGRNGDYRVEISINKFRQVAACSGQLIFGPPEDVHNSAYGVFCSFISLIKCLTKCNIYFL